MKKFTIMTTEQREEKLNAAGYNVEEAIGGYYILTKDGEDIHRDSACEDVQERESAVDFFYSLVFENN